MILVKLKKFYVAQEDVLLLDETEEKGGEVISKNFVMEFQWRWILIKHINLILQKYLKKQWKRGTNATKNRGYKPCDDIIQPIIGL